MKNEQKRKYTFKNKAYWDKAREPRKLTEIVDSQPETWTPNSMDISTAGSVYNSSSPSSSSGSRSFRKKITGSSSDFSYLKDLPLPFSSEGQYISITDVVNLCQRVYANIAIFRNTVDMMTEFSCAPIYLTGGNATSRKFIEKWLQKIDIIKLKQVHFREYYRSGNVFVFRFDGAFSEEDFKTIKKSTAAKKNVIPVRYTILNPADMAATPASSFDKAEYKKVLNDYEIQRLKDKKTAEDKALYSMLPQEVKQSIESGSSSKNGVEMPINSKSLTAVFYKKQPYEPFGIPFGFAVFRDLNLKEELKKLDQQLAAAANNWMLLVTMGEKKDQYGGGINAKAMQKMQELLLNESVGRVLVSDYTTDAKFVIPEISEILNPIKYQIINQDIKEGLYNMMAGEEKFANTTIKAKVFVERLNEGQNVFIDEFLQKEVDEVCLTMGFKAIPKVNFQQIDFADNTQMNRVYTRLTELGILTPEQCLDAMKTNVLPENDQLKEAQDKFIQDKKDGRYMPLVGGSATTEEGAGRPSGTTGIPKETTNVGPIGSNASLVEISKTKHLVGLSKLKIVAENISRLMNKAEASIKRRFKIEKLNDKQQDLVYRLATNIISYSKLDDWDKKLNSVLKEPEKNIVSIEDNEVSKAVYSLASEHNVDIYSAAILYHSKWQQ